MCTCFAVKSHPKECENHACFIAWGGVLFVLYQNAFKSPEHQHPNIPEAQTCQGTTIVTSAQQNSGSSIYNKRYEPDLQ